MGLALSLVLLTEGETTDGQKTALTSHYVDYLYRLRDLQGLYAAHLFLSQKRHCGKNLHSKRIDPVMRNSANNVAALLAQEDLHRLCNLHRKNVNNAIL